MRDIIDELRVDVARKTIGELVRDREAAAQEIERLRAQRANFSEKEEAPRAARSYTPSLLESKALLRIRDVCDALGMLRSTIYAKLREGAFPEPVRISQRAVRWRASDVVAWLKEL